MVALVAATFEIGKDGTMLKKLMHMAVAIALLGAVTMQSTTPADARGGRTAGVVAGTIIGLGILGAAAAARDRDDYYYRDTCYEGARRCEVVGERCYYNRYGEYRCKDDVRCWRPRHCD
jgi:hypothetical protein